MYLGIDVHKRYAQVAVMDEAGTVVEEVRVDGGPQWPGEASVSHGYRQTATAPQNTFRPPVGCVTADHPMA